MPRLPKEGWVSWNRYVGNQVMGFTLLKGYMQAYHFFEHYRGHNMHKKIRSRCVQINSRDFQENEFASQTIIPLC